MKKNLRSQLAGLSFCLALGLVLPANAQLTTEQRTLDGSGNNPQNSLLGQVGSQLSRKAAADYGDGVSTLAGSSRPNVREISNAIFDQPMSLPDSRGLNDLTWAWGQFLAHDLDHTLLQSGGETANIIVPNDDPIFTAGAIVPVDRSQFDPATGTDAMNPRQQFNNITAWIDANTVYGGMANEANGGLERANWLRTGSNGRLETSLFNGEVFLPVASQKPNAPSMAEGPMGINSNQLFIAGDVRANEHGVLSAMHTLFVREHNRVADLIAGNAPNLPADPVERDEEIFQSARKIVGATVQGITYNDYLPALGIDLNSYAGYDSTIDPSLTNEFSTAGFRLGHSQISGIVKRLNADGSSHPAGDLNLFEGFFAPERLLETGLDPLLRGLAADTQEATDVKMRDSLRNLLFGFPSGGPIANGSDLAALNIQRGRDHGLNNYNATRVAYGLDPVTSFAEITSDPLLQAGLADLYGSIDELDLWVGMLAEDRVWGASLGELNIAILKDQFERLRDGDRFWYANDLDFGPGSSLAEMGFTFNYFETVTLAQVIELNTGVNSWGQERSAFFAPTVPEPSSTLAFFALGTIGAGSALKRKLKPKSPQKTKD